MHHGEPQQTTFTVNSRYNNDGIKYPQKHGRLCDEFRSSGVHPVHERDISSHN